MEQLVSLLRCPATLSARQSPSRRCCATRAAALAQAELSPPRGDTKGAVLVIENVMLSVGPKDLLTGASLRVEAGETVGLVGANGCGKSTLLRCLAGQRECDGGRVACAHDTHVGYLEQTGTGGSTRTVYEEARSRMSATAAAAALEQEEAAAAAAPPSSSAAAAAALLSARDAYEAAGGASAAKRISATLDGLGFAREKWHTPCSQLSGGWQMRVALARLLLSPAGESAADGGSGGLLLLDEPTNHLDAASSAFLSSWLRTSGAAAVIVSHDETLLATACTRLAEVRNGQLHLYVGSYARFLEERTRRAEALLQTEERMAAEAGKLEGFITRFGAKATKAAAAKSKEKALARLNEERADRSELDAARSAIGSDGPGDATRVALRLPPPPPGAVDTLVLEKASFGWGPPESGLRDVSLTLRRGTRTVVCGVNGAGKSTLLAALAGSLPLRAGHLRLGDGSRVAVFRQDLAQDLPADAIALEHVTDAARVFAPDTPDERVRAVLGALGLRGDAALRQIGQLSGGEKARVALAALVLSPASVLLLDEPTNHLVLASLTSLSLALHAWSGAVVAVTHNRAFAVSLKPTHLLSVAASRASLSQTSGDLSEADWDAALEKAQRSASDAAAAPAPQAEQKESSFEERKRAQRTEARLDKLMALIEQAEQSIAEEDAAVAAAFERGDSAAAEKAVRRKEALEAKVAAYFAEAEELSSAAAPV